ncbi:hypothetical protein RAS1_31190 [Phycisphaerae bacterium RAS1]|nr:hypothetical protein RAS1_31190 [Phycisphaerae bacterium RAS1]
MKLRFRHVVVPMLTVWPLLVASSCPDPEIANRNPRVSLNIVSTAAVDDAVALDGSASNVYRTYLFLCPGGGVYVFVTLVDGVSAPVDSQYFFFTTLPGEQLLLEAGSGINGGVWFVETPDNYNVVVRAEFGTVNPPNQDLLDNGARFYIHTDGAGNLYVNGVRATVRAAGDTCFAS